MYRIEQVIQYIGFIYLVITLVEHRKGELQIDAQFDFYSSC